MRLLSTIFLGVFILSHQLFGSDTAIVVDFETAASNYQLGNFSGLTDKNPLQGKKSLLIDTLLTDAWSYHEILSLSPGMILPGKDYQISFAYRIEEQHDLMTTFYYLLRSKSARGRDLYFHSSYFGTDSLLPKTGRMTFAVRIATVADYYLMFGVYGRGKILIDDIRIKLLSAAESAALQIDPTQSTPMPEDLANNEKNITGCPEFEIQRPDTQGMAVVNAADFGMSPDSADNTSAFNRAAEQCRMVNAGELIIPAGKYYFDNAMPAVFENCKNLLVNGNGAEFISRNAKLGTHFFALKNCHRVEVRNLIIDWDWEKVPLASRVKVLNTDPEGKFTDLLFIDYKKFPAPDLPMHYFDNLLPDKGRVVLNSMLRNGVIGEVKLSREWLKDNVVRLHTPTQAEMVRREFFPGRQFRLRHFFNDRQAVRLENSTHITLNQLKIYSFPGTGFAFKRQASHWQLLGCAIIPRPGTNRPITVSGDHYHILYSSGWFKLEDCHFEGGGDDMMNIKGALCYGIRRISEQRLEVFNLPEWQTQFDAGNHIELFNGMFVSLWRGTVAKASWDKKKKAYVIDTVEKLPEFPERTLLVNRDYASDNFIIRNCTFVDGEAQGLLIQSSNGLVENCTFRQIKGPALQFSTGYSITWQEGRPMNNIIIRNNRIENCNYENKNKYGQSEMIYVGMFGTMGRTAYPVVTDVLFSGNEFYDITGLAFNISSARNIIIRKNRLFNTVDADYNQFPGGIMLHNTSKVFIEGNSWQEKCRTPKIYLEQPQTEKPWCRDNLVSALKP